MLPGENFIYSALIILMIASVDCRTIKSDSEHCTYTFYVPTEQNSTCPHQEDGGLTKAELTNLVTNQQKQLMLLTQKLEQTDQELREKLTDIEHSAESGCLNNTELTNYITNQQQQLALLTQAKLELKQANLELTQQLKDIKLEMQKQMNELNAIRQSVEEVDLNANHVTSRLNNQQQQLAMLTENDLEMKKNSNELKDEDLTLRIQLEEVQQVLNDRPTATNYIRWGRSDCPSKASVLYSGYAATSDHDHVGGGADFLCLHDDPQWPQGFASGHQSHSYIEGVEYEDSAIISLTNEDVPCVACEANRAQMMMTPGRTECNKGWTLEYTGILMSSRYDSKKATFICVDRSPEVILGGSANNQDGRLYGVEVSCGSLPCRPYVSGHEVACVVCTK